MREQAMVTWRPFQKAEHEGETVRCFVPCDPAALGRDNDRHDRKAGPARSNEIVAGVRGEPGAVVREAGAVLNVFVTLARGWHRLAIPKSGVRRRGPFVSRAVPEPGSRGGAPGAGLRGLRSGGGPACKSLFVCPPARY